jgi:hypothetical protein
MHRSTGLARFSKPQPCNNEVNTMPILIAALMMTVSLNLSIKTDGGFTGRGVGQLAIDGDKATTERCEGTVTAEERQQLIAAISVAKKLKWSESYGHAHPDAVRWTLETAGRTTSWYDGNDLPKELQELRDLAWKVRGRVVSECK